MRISVHLFIDGLHLGSWSSGQLDGEGSEDVVSNPAVEGVEKVNPHVTTPICLEFII
jgi:hypothetical protein